MQTFITFQKSGLSGHTFRLKRDQSDIVCFKCKKEVNADMDTLKFGSIVHETQPDRIELAWEFFCSTCSKALAEFIGTGFGEPV